jgi:hypothetical protein
VPSGGAAKIQIRSEREGTLSSKPVDDGLGEAAMLNAVIRGGDPRRFRLKEGPRPATAWVRDEVWTGLPVYALVEVILRSRMDLIDSALHTAEPHGAHKYDSTARRIAEAATVVLDISTIDSVTPSRLNGHGIGNSESHIGFVRH